MTNSKDLIDKMYEDVYKKIDKLTPNPNHDYGFEKDSNLNIIVGITALAKDKFMVRVQNINDFSVPEYVTGSKDEIMVNLKKAIINKVGIIYG